MRRAHPVEATLLRCAWTATGPAGSASGSRATAAEAPTRRPRSRAVVLASRLLLVVLLVVVGGCGLPRDPRDTLERVRGGTLRVGLVADEPWARHQRGVASGVEVTLVEGLARELGARVAWVPGGETRLLDDLEHFRLDLVVGGLTRSSPWRDRVGMSLPHAVREVHGDEREHVFAVPPGENGWLLAVDRYLHRHRGSGT